jgi:hypothetical protein
MAEDNVKYNDAVNLVAEATEKLSGTSIADETTV